MTSSSKWHRSSRALGALAAGLLAALALPAQAQTHVDNPFAGALMYVNPEFTADAAATAATTTDASLAAQMRVVGNNPTAIWLDSIAAVPSLATHLDHAIATGSNLALFVLHDMPGRTCGNLVADGELPLTTDGLANYETYFIDAIAATSAQAKYAGVRVVFVVEPRSLADLVTGGATTPACAQAYSTGIYFSALRYAVNKLHAIPNVYLYLDLAHAGWLGWTVNSARAVTLVGSLSTGFTDGKYAIDGFSTNVADFVPTLEPWLTDLIHVSGQQVSSARFYEYNPNIDDAKFAADLWKQLTTAGWPTTIGMLEDSSRNGWGGSQRPTGGGTSSDISTFVDQSRVDRRTTRSAWCNPSGAGLGERPVASPPGYPDSHFDAFVWVKTPGLSDGDSSDSGCNPSGLTPDGYVTNALPGAPAAGQWFPAQFTQLVQNMWPAIAVDPTFYPLTVQEIIGGSGTGSVTSTPAGIRCPSTCTASFQAGTQVTLTASTIPGAQFSGWSGGACSGSAPTCVVTVKAATTVNATFVGPGIGYILSVYRDGTGSGTVVSSPANIQCGYACQAMFVGSTAVTLTATPAAGSSFAGWGGACKGTQPTCIVSMTATKQVTATFQPGTWYSLDVLVSEDVCNPPPGCVPGQACVTVCYGGNAVTSTPAGISCGGAGSACSAAFASGTSVVLTAVPYSTNLFAGWLGACGGSTAPTCTVPMTQAQSVTARFVDSRSYTLHVSKGGTGAGKVTGWGGAIDCGTTCNALFTTGTSVTLTAAPAAGSIFTGWSGGCTGTATTCTVPMSAEQYVTATFGAVSPSYTLTAQRISGGMGAGTVTSTPAGINCGTTCAALFTAGGVVTLTATPATGSTFAGWGGACAGTTGTICKVTMTAALTATAAFSAPTTLLLTVTKTGLGTGTVISTPSGIQCGSTCTANFVPSTTVTLTAAAASGSVWVGWGGACTGSTATCVVTMNQAQSVTASFGGPNPIFTVTKSGTGAGTVLSTPSGINCGSVCSASIPAQAVTLTATATAGSTFAGWSGGCTGTAATCVLTADSLTQKASATATFNLAPATPCTNPITFTNNTGNFNTTNAVCYRTSQKVSGWGCSNIAGRTVKVNGGAATATCGAGPFPLAKAADGYTYFALSAGQYPWASVYVW